MRYAVTMLAVTLFATSARAQATVLFKHDQFPSAIVDASNEISGLSMTVNPGFVATEAFGQVYQPDAGDYPLRITGIEMVLAAPPNASGTMTANATIEFWFHAGAGPDPGLVEPTFSISTDVLYDRVNQTSGQPLQGNTAMQIEFDWSDPSDLTAHPPELTSGSFTVMIRFQDAAQALFFEWNYTSQCLLSDFFCGCQAVGTLQDQAITPSANILHILDPLGTCSGSTYVWHFADTVGVSGDFILRVRAETGGGTCTPDCTGKDCGDNGCGGSCGTCDSGMHCAASGECIEDTCVADCAGKDCGADGCGGFCGTCATGTHCDAAGLCVADAGTNMPRPEDDDGGCAQQPGSYAGALLVALLLLRRRRA